MILFDGKIFDTLMQDELIAKLPQVIDETYKDGLHLDPKDVIDACSTLARRVADGAFDDIVLPFMEKFGIGRDYLERMIYLFTAEGLTTKLNTELPPLGSDPDGIRRVRYPLGVLLHIAAGNFDVLPAYSVIEGLLAGNINILKLPMGDSGLSVKLLSELIDICPRLAPFIYVFDVPSTETASLVRLAEMSNGIAVWGGDQALEAARRLAPINTKIISWGHKLSFAYAELDCTDDSLKELARSICMTNQTLCSSCQGIFVDTTSDEELVEFGKRFYSVLSEVNSFSSPADYGMRAKNAINIYNEKLESESRYLEIFSGNGISVIVRPDSELDLSYMYRSVWVRKLPSSEIYTLRKHKSYLQTAAVLTSSDVKRSSVSELLANAGVVRITSGGTMSDTLPGEAHDGTYALREYTRIVEFRD